MDEYTRHQRVFSFFSVLVSPLMRRKFRYSYEPVPAMDTPFFLLCNHNMEVDPILLGLAAKRQVYFVASEHILRKGLGTWFLMRYFKPIIHTKGKAGLQSSMEILCTLKAGRNVALFPEGNRSFNGVTMPLFPATAKLAKRSGAALVTYRIEGGYLTQPRWSLSLRRGRLRGKLVHIYTPAELKAMSDAEIIAAVEADLHEDAYETQRRDPVAFSGHDLALGLETTLFTCPRCGKIGTLSTHSDTIVCSCGFHAVYDVYGMLTDDQGEAHTVTEWDTLQKEQLSALRDASDADTPLFSDRVRLLQINDHEIEKNAPVTLTAYRDHFAIDDTVIAPDTLEGMAIFSRNVLIVHRGRQYEVRGNDSFSALKYLYLYQLMTAK